MSGSASEFPKASVPTRNLEVLGAIVLPVRLDIQNWGSVEQVQTRNVKLVPLSLDQLDQSQSYGIGSGRRVKSEYA